MQSYNKNEWDNLNSKSFKNEHSSLKDLMFKYIGYWPLFAGLLILSGSAAWFYISSKIPEYEITASLLIKDEKKGIEDSKGVEPLNLFNSKKIVENEIEVLKSHTLAQEVVKNLHLYASISEGGTIEKPAYISSPIQIIAANPESTKEVKKQYFKYISNTNRVLLNGVQYPLNAWLKMPFGIIQFKHNPHFKPSLEQKTLFFSLSTIKKTANYIESRLKVTAANKLSSVIYLSIKDAVPQRGEDIINELLATYNKASINDKNMLAANTLSFVEDRFKLVSQDLDSIEKKMQSYKTRNNIVDISTQGKLFLENVEANDQRISDINMQLAILNQVEIYVSGKGAQGGIVPSTLGLTDPVLPDLLDKLYNAELEYEKIKKIAPENNPTLVSLTDQIQKIKPSIIENIQNQRKSLQAGKNNLSVTNGKYVTLLQTIPEKERELLEISRQHNIKNNIYTFLLQKREEAALSYSSSVGDSRLVDKAQSTDKPVSPKKILIYLFAFVAAFGIGIGLIFIKESFNERINSRSEVEGFTKIPVLGEIVYNDLKESIVVTKEKQSLIAEQFRHLRTSLGNLNINARRKKVLITSSISGEGKSFVASNLAISLALLANKKVILLELDMRKPKLAEIFNVTQSVGISDFLQDEKEIEEIIKRTSICESLFLIPAGTIPNNPSELLINGKIDELFTYLEKIFDYIIIDSTPVCPVTDAYILSPLCDATLYVIRPGVTPRNFVRDLDEQFQTKSLKNTAIILNGIKTKGFGRQNYYYNYGFDYVKDHKKLSSTKA